MHIVFAILAVVGIVFAVIFMTERQWYTVAMLGIGVAAGSMISMIGLNITLIRQGEPGSMFGVVFGQWGQARPAIPIAYCAGAAIGLLIMAYGLIRVTILKQRNKGQIPEEPDGDNGETAE